MGGCWCELEISIWADSTIVAPRGWGLELEIHALIDFGCALLAVALDLFIEWHSGLILVLDTADLPDSGV